MRIPIGENEMGAIYKCGETGAFFYTLDSAFYNNCMLSEHYSDREFRICTYSEFKKLYPTLIYSNYRSKRIY